MKPIKSIIQLFVITILLYAMNLRADTVKVVLENHTGKTLTVELYGEFDTGMFPAPIGGFITNGIAPGTTNIFYINTSCDLNQITWFSVTWNSEAFECEVCCTSIIDAWLSGSAGSVPAGSIDPSYTQLNISINGGYNTCTQSGEYDDGSAIFGPPDEC